jgi:TonB-linked SusC/RagA family outer membrane protein
MTKVLKIFRKRHQFLFRFFVLTFLFNYSLFAYNQEDGILIQGKILDDKTNESLLGATVKVKEGGEQGTVADATGNFSLKVKSLPITLVVSNLGYKEQELDVYEYSKPITVFLPQDLNTLNAVVVVGYGTQKKKELTGSISSISSTVLETQVAPSFDNLLGGSVSGLTVTQSSGQPGASSSVRIRGGNSINSSNEPLYVIDGFAVYNNNSFANSNTSTTTTQTKSAASDLNVLATINPEDIESIEVLKDASATAIYGSRGANGVVLISTKKGKKGPAKISYQTAFGWQQISKKLDYLNGSEWATLYNKILTNGGSKAAFTQDQIDAIGDGYDYQSEALRKGNIQSHQVSISGGDEKTRYALSGNYYNQDGIILNTGFKRYSGHVSLDRDVAKNFKVGVNLIASNSTQNVLTSGGSALSNGDVSNAWVSILRAVPIVPIYNADGTYNYVNPYSDATVSGVSPNLIADLVNTVDQVKVNRTLGNFYADYKIIPSLTAKVNVGADLVNSKQNIYAPKTTTLGISTNGYAYVGSKAVNSYQAEFTLNYDKEINKRNYINALVGYTTQRSDLESVSASATNFTNDQTTYNNLSSGTVAASTSYGSTSILNSYLGRINYSYLHRYNLTTTLRADGSSRFAENHKWGYFPSVGLSWNINDEPFFKNVKNVSNLKFRVSAGVTGNQEIGDYQYLSQLASEKYSFNGTVVSGYATTNISNADLKWESTAQYDAGFDIGLLKDRVSLVVDAYYKKTSNLLLTLPIPSTSGYTSALENIGAVSNKGLELSVNAKIIKNKHFNWDLTASIAKNVNEVLDLGGLTSFQPTYASYAMNYVLPTIVQVGEPLGSFYGYVYKGVVQAGQDLSTVPLNSFTSATTKKVGDPIFEDVNGDGKIDSNDKVLLGNTQPKFTYGFNSTFNYKNVDFSFIFQGSYGNKLYNALANRSESTSIYYNSSSVVADALNGSTSVASIAARSTSSYYLDSRYIEDASYLRLKSLTIGYTVPVRLGKQKEKTKFRFSLSAQNLLTFTHYSGSDPEASQSGGSSEQSSLYQGIDFGAYPSTKTFLFGIGVTL